MLENLNCAVKIHGLISIFEKTHEKQLPCRFFTRFHIADFDFKKKKLGFFLNKTDQWAKR